MNTKEIKSYDFKLRWVEDDIGDFNIHIDHEILSCENKNVVGDELKTVRHGYDRLINILFSHGDSE